MPGIITVGLDLAKNGFQVHGTDATGGAVLRKKPRRAQVLEFFEALPLASWLWKHAAALITGGARSASWATKCG